MEVSEDKTVESEESMEVDEDGYRSRSKGKLVKHDPSSEFQNYALSTISKLTINQLLQNYFSGVKVQIFTLQVNIRILDRVSELRACYSIN